MVDECGDDVCMFVDGVYGRSCVSMVGLELELFPIEGNEGMVSAFRDKKAAVVVLVVEGGGDIEEDLGQVIVRGTGTGGKWWCEK